MILRKLAQGVALSAVLFGSQAAAGLPELDLSDEDSIKTVAATVAYNTMSYYNENQTGQIPGKLPDTWWEGGFLFNMLINYWYYTGDTSYNPTVNQGMLLQAGDDYNYMPANWSKWLGNDDQVFWGLAAMSAAELNYPETDNQPSWLALAQAVFNTQAERWDYSSCEGGLRWQLNIYQQGYTMKNSVSNGGFFQLASRLALYTGNKTYANWATRMWDWSTSVPLINATDLHVADSTDTPDNCSTRGDLQWTYNYGVYLMGSAYMYNYTNGSSLWGDRVDGLLSQIWGNFFPQKYGGNIMAEPACDVNMLCNRDQNCFKGLLSAYLAFTTYLVPSTQGAIVPKLQASAQAAQKACSGGANGQQCGVRWWQPSWDKTQGIEQSASVLSIMSVQMLGKTGGPPKTGRTGGTSKSDPGAGNGPSEVALDTISGADRAGAAILTILVLGAVLGGGVWLVWP